MNEGSCAVQHRIHPREFPFHLVCALETENSPLYPQFLRQSLDPLSIPPGDDRSHPLLDGGPGNCFADESRSTIEKGEGMELSRRSSRLPL